MLLKRPPLRSPYHALIASPRASPARSWQQMMRARLGIDKNNSWADWAEEEEEAAEPTKTLADAKYEVAGEVLGMRLRGGGLPRHASAHGQEGDGGVTLTEGGLPTEQSSERSIFGSADHDVQLLMMCTRAAFYAAEPSNAAAYAPVEACGAHEWSCIAHGWRAVSAACGPKSDASTHGQEGGGGGALTEGGQQPLLSLSMRLRGGGSGEESGDEGGRDADAFEGESDASDGSGDESADEDASDVDSISRFPDSRHVAHRASDASASPLPRSRSLPCALHTSTRMQSTLDTHAPRVRASQAVHMSRPN